MSGGQQTARRSAWRIWLMVAMLVAMVVVGIGQWWIDRPSQAGQHFIWLLSKNQNEEARAMLLDPASLTIGAGKITLQAADGTTDTFTEVELPLFALRSPRFQHRHGWSDYFAGRYRFKLTSSSIATMRLVEITCVVEGDRIVIATIRKIIQ